MIDNENADVMIEECGWEHLACKWPKEIYGQSSNSFNVSRSSFFISDHERRKLMHDNTEIGR